MKVNKNKSLNKLLDYNWKGDLPDEDNTSYEEYNYYKLIDKPLKKYDPSDIYFMIGQNTGLDYLIPMAIELLLKDIFLEAEDYCGDLLINVMKIKEEEWSKFKKEKKKLISLLKSNIKTIKDLEEEPKRTQKFLKKEITKFLEKYS